MFIIFLANNFMLRIYKVEFLNTVDKNVNHIIRKGRDKLKKINTKDVVYKIICKKFYIVQRSISTTRTQKKT